MKIIITTENKAKIQGVTEILNRVWNDLEIISEKFPSDISEQPLSEVEGITGALNRAKNAQTKYPEADYCIGIEGFVDTNEHGMFLGGTVVILNAAGEYGIGTSAKALMPNFLREKVAAGAELGPLVKELMNDTDGTIRQTAGTLGILSKGLYDRVAEFEDATKCALAKFLSPEFYNK